MTRLAWNAVGERFFEAGVDHGVLYVDGSDGVPWNGLISVSETSTGGEVTPYYVDGQKYLNRRSLEEFEATIEAFTYPEEFEQCDGTQSVGSGLLISQQTRKPFGFSYRTGIGNDIDGANHSYKIHLVYGATAAPSDRSHGTLTDTLDADNFSWHVVTKPPAFVGYRPTSHFVVDSSRTPLELLDEIESLIYGTDNAPAQLPSAVDLITLFVNYAIAVLDAGSITNLEPPDPIYDEATKLITIPDIPGLVYSINGVVASPGVYGPIDSDTAITATAEAGYDFNSVTTIVDAGRVTDAASTLTYDGGTV